MSAVRRESLPRYVERKLHQEVGSRCPVCGESDVRALTIHHIVPYVVTGKHNPDAMIVLCANCHARAQRREITEDELFVLKQKLGLKRETAGPASRKIAEIGPQSIHVGEQVADQILNVAGPTTIKVPAGRSRKVVFTAPPGSISDAQLREINDQAARIAKESGGRVAVGRIKKRIMQKWSLTSVRNLPQREYPSVLAFLRRHKWGQRAGETPSQERTRLMRQAHARASNIGWGHEQLSDTCKQWYGSSLGNLSIHLLRDLVSRLERNQE